MKFKKEVTFKLGELFCGPGGIALGAFKTRIIKDDCLWQIKHAWANDYDFDTCQTYNYNLCPEQPETVICKDIRDLKIELLSQIDAFAYGFPCNDFSVIGEQKGFRGEFGPLYSYGVEVINYFKPKFFFAENVGGIRNIDEGTVLNKILSELQNAGRGYRLTTHLYKFEEYGVPQTRHRVIIVGIEKTLDKVFCVPAPTHKNKPISAREALECPPIPKDAPNQEATAQSERVVRRLTYIKPGENCWNADLPQSLRLKVKGAKLSQIYRRLHPSRPSYTITGSGGGGTHGYHWEEPRALTNRERARLQTFPDNYYFKGNKDSVRKQIGMAVSPLMSEIIFNSILMTLAGIKYNSIDSCIGNQIELFEEILV
ncbi:MAG: DNA (cytosine-5-)-methyltransferase [Candidatus Omnitrophica bacterium]|nr:DNA (cytosine-5-)-methyltransferase [Candidatus Omnitrophota bacterium]